MPILFKPIIDLPLFISSFNGPKRSRMIQLETFGESSIIKLNRMQVTELTRLMLNWLDETKPATSYSDDNETND